MQGAGEGACSCRGGWGLEQVGGPCPRGCGGLACSVGKQHGAGCAGQHPAGWAQGWTWSIRLPSNAQTCGWKCLSPELLSIICSLRSMRFSASSKMAWDFPGGPLVKTSGSQCRGHRFDPWSGN